MRFPLTLLALLPLVFALAANPAYAPFTSTQGFLSVNGTWITDSTGHPVILRGVNYPGYAAEGSRLKVHSESDYRMFAQLGFNVVRLPISWSKLERAPGTFSYSYLISYVDKDIQWAKLHGLYVILNMHQLYWAARWGGDGAPDWSVRNYPATETGMRQAVTDFWTTPSLQDHFIETWKKIAQQYANEPTVAGYDILNEPWVYTSIVNVTASDVNRFYEKTIESIRTVDPNHIIFLEPANILPSTSPSYDNIVWSPHFYALSFFAHYNQTSASLLQADMAWKYQKFVEQLKAPMWIGEFGAYMNDQSSLQWLTDAVSIFNNYEVGWAWWAVSSTNLGGIPAALYTAPVSKDKVTQAVTQTSPIPSPLVPEDANIATEDVSKFVFIILSAACAVLFVATLLSTRRHTSA